MKWNSEYVRRKYGFQFLGRDGVYYPCKDAKRLIVSFSSMGKDRYDRYSWFWQEDEVWPETAYLFIKDDDFQYFLGNDAKPLFQTFRKLILRFMDMSGVGAQQVFTIGGSMGGYAAIYYASVMQLNGALMTNPQLDYASARAHQYQNWERQIRSTGAEWYDIAEFVHKWPAMPNVYIEYGNYRADKIAAEKLIEALSQAPNSLFIVRKTDWSVHAVNSLSKTTIESVIRLFENHGFGETGPARGPKPENADIPVAELEAAEEADNLGSRFR